jgi:vanillate O-demethylase monooxygenase subunit
MLEAQQRGIEANPGYDFYNLNIDSGSLWTRRLVARMIDSEAGSDVGNGTSGDAAAATSAVVAAANADREARPNGVGQSAEVAGDVSHHRDEPGAGLMQRGL